MIREIYTCCIFLYDGIISFDKLIYLFFINSSLMQKNLLTIYRALRPLLQGPEIYRPLILSYLQNSVGSFIPSQTGKQSEYLPGLVYPNLQNQVSCF